MEFTNTLKEKIDNVYRANNWQSKRVIMAELFTYMSKPDVIYFITTNPPFQRVIELKINELRNDISSRATPLSAAADADLLSTFDRFEKKLAEGIVGFSALIDSVEGEYIAREPIARNTEGPRRSARIARRDELLKKAPVVK